MKRAVFLKSLVLFWFFVVVHTVAMAQVPWSTAYNYNGGYAVVYSDGSVSGENISSGLVSWIKEYRQKGYRISSIAFTKSGGWVVLCQNGAFHYYNIPSNLKNKLHSIKSQGDSGRSVAISSSGSWILITKNKHYYYGNMYGSKVPNALREKNKIGITKVECSSTGVYSISTR